MADLLLDVQGHPNTPAAGQAVIYVNTTTKSLSYKNDAGLVRQLGVVNFSTANQNFTAATRTYITGSAIVIPAGTLQVGSMFRWTFDLTKTAAGIAASTFDISFGTTGTVSDVAQVSFIKPAGLATVDEGTITIICVIRSIGATGVAVGQFHMTHNQAASGHAMIPCVDVNTVSAGFSMTTVTNIGLCITSGAADVVNTQLILAEAFNI